MGIFGGMGSMEMKVAEENILKRKMKENSKLSKVKSMVDNINEIILDDDGYYSNFVEIHGNRPLSFVFDYEELNDYAKVIFHFSLLNNDVCGVNTSGWDEEKHKYSREVDKQDAISYFLQSCGEKSHEDTSPDLCKYEFLLWCLLVIAVDKQNEEKNISAICDFLALTNIKKEEIEDVIYIVKMILRDISDDYIFQTESVPRELCSVIDYYK